MKNRFFFTYVLYKSLSNTIILPFFFFSKALLQKNLPNTLLLYSHSTAVAVFFQSTAIPNQPENTVKMAASGLMPEEMVVQILARLHPKSLMRFECVRKSWYALINDPQFVNKHPHSYNDVSSSTRILLKGTMAKETETTKEEVASSFLDLPNDSDSAIED